MTEVAYPVVYAALHTLADSTLTDVRVVDGFDFSQDPGDVLLLGVPNITDATAIAAGSFDQDMATLGTTHPRDETGAINCVLMAWVGETDETSADAARTKAFGYLTELAVALRAAPKLGTSLAYLKAQLGSGSIAEDKAAGATCSVSFTVVYKARI